MWKNRCCAATVLTVTALIAFICFQCYRDITMPQRKLDEAIQLMKRGELTPAREAFIAAERLGADRIICLSNVAECEIKLGMYESALATCDRLNATPGGEAMGYTFRGLVFQRQEKLVMARLEFKHALEAGNEYAATNIRILDRKRKP